MKQIIKTSSWFVKLPGDHVRIGISRGTPRGQPAGYRRYQKLNPGPWFNKCPSPQAYLQLYFEDVLNPLDPQQVVDDLMAIADGRIPTLLCYEPPTPGEKWCHRALVAAWLKDKLDLDVFEYGQEHEGCGWFHPKLHPSLRHKVPPPVPDHSATIRKLIGTVFKHRGATCEVVGVDKLWPDHATVTDGAKFFPVPLDALQLILAKQKTAQTKSAAR